MRAEGGKPMERLWRLEWKNCIPGLLTEGTGLVLSVGLIPKMGSSFLRRGRNANEGDNGGGVVEIMEAKRVVPLFWKERGRNSSLALLGKKLSLPIGTSLLWSETPAWILCSSNPKRAIGDWELENELNSLSSLLIKARALRFLMGLLDFQCDFHVFAFWNRNNPQFPVNQSTRNIHSSAFLFSF